MDDLIKALEEAQLAETRKRIAGGYAGIRQRTNEEAAKEAVKALIGAGYTITKTEPTG